MRAVSTAIFAPAMLVRTRRPMPDPVDPFDTLYRKPDSPSAGHAEQLVLAAVAPVVFGWSRQDAHWHI